MNVIDIMIGDIWLLTRTAHYESRNTSDTIFRVSIRRHDQRDSACCHHGRTPSAVSASYTDVVGQLKASVFVGIRLVGVFL
jgi:hypothetical protein